MGYEIYDRESRNLISYFRTEAEALAMVRRAINIAGPESVGSWVMGSVDGTDENVLSGKHLVARAIQVPA